MYVFVYLECIGFRSIEEREKPFRLSLAFQRGSSFHPSGVVSAVPTRSLHHQ